MAYLSREDIEHIARKYLKRYKRIYGCLGEDIVSIDPTRMAVGVLGLNIAYHHLSLDGTILGATTLDRLCVSVYDNSNEGEFIELDGKTLLIERSLREDRSRRGRLNFTILHEAGHQILEHMYPRKRTVSRAHFYRSKPEPPSDSEQDWGEWQADTLASSLLLPEELVRKAMTAVGLGDRIDYLNQVFRAREYGCFCRMAELLGASKQSLSIRMRQLGLLGQDQTRNPNALVDIF